MILVNATKFPTSYTNPPQHLQLAQCAEMQNFIFSPNAFCVIYQLESSAPLRGLLSSSCGGLGPFGPKSDFAGQTDGQRV